MDAIPFDTSIEAAKRQFDILRKLGPQVRAAMAFEMSDSLRDIVESGVKLRHPDYNEHKVKQEVLRLMVGDTLFKQIQIRL